jgi:hypothetical protein
MLRGSTYYTHRYNFLFRHGLSPSALYLVTTSSVTSLDVVASSSALEISGTLSYTSNSYLSIKFTQAQSVLVTSSSDCDCLFNFRARAVSDDGAITQ